MTETVTLPPYVCMEDFLKLFQKKNNLEKENEELKAKIEKMKCCWNCKNFNSECEYCKLDKSLRSFWDDCNKWELAE